MTNPDTSQISDKVIQDIAKKVSGGPARAMWAVFTAIIGASFYLAYAIAGDVTHEADQDRKIEDNGNRSEKNYGAIRDIAYWLIEQSRRTEKLATLTAPEGTVIPDRPQSLKDAEKKLIGAQK